MKDFTVTIRYQGLTGEYTSRVDVRAKNEASARKKASKTIGNRDGYVVSVVRAMTPEQAQAWRAEEGNDYYPSQYPSQRSFER